MPSIHGRSLPSAHWTWEIWHSPPTTDCPARDGAVDLGIHFRHTLAQGAGPHADHLGKQVAVYCVAVPTTASPALEVHGKLVARS